MTRLPPLRPLSAPLIHASLRHNPTPRLPAPLLPLRPQSTSTTVDPAEIARFSRLAHEWWNPDGPYALLRRMNPVRVKWAGGVLQRYGRSWEGRVADVGCGGGFLSEALARLGGKVTGIDASAENISVAQAHAALDPGLADKQLDYMVTTAESLAASQPASFNNLFAMEIIEHLASLPPFLHACRDLVEPGGLIFLSTINRTPFSYFLTIFMAERVLGLVPPGTHQHEKYVTPEELERAIEEVGGLEIVDVKGVGYDPLARDWFTMGASEPELMGNYFVAVRRVR